MLSSSQQMAVRVHSPEALGWPVLLSLALHLTLFLSLLIIPPVIAPDGKVTSIEVVQGSGLSVLNAAAVAVFRNAHLPPFPPGAPAQPADVVLTLHYRPADSGG
jgi:TonB family protein